VKEEFKLKDILKEYGSYSKSKTSHFKGDILAYVTPVSFIIKLSSISIYYVGKIIFSHSKTFFLNVKS
jgi:hypothetical protein